MFSGSFHGSVERNIPGSKLGGWNPTLFSPSGANGSVIHEPKRDPDVLTVTGSLIAVSFPHAAKRRIFFFKKRGRHHEGKNLQVKGAIDVHQREGVQKEEE